MAPPPPPAHLLSPKPEPDAPLSPQTQQMLLTPKAEPDAAPPADLALEHFDPHRQQQLEPYPDPQHRFCATPAANLYLPPAGKGSLPPPPQSAIVASASSTGKKRKRQGNQMMRASAATAQDCLYSRSLVRAARLTFEALRVHFTRHPLPDAPRNRIDLRACNAMRVQGLSLYREPRIVGAIPGVSVGDAFFYRAELCVVGLHRTTQSGISFVPAGLVLQGHPVATSIVSSGVYHDDQDSGDVLVYTGSGGRKRNRVEHFEDQKADSGGNLALHNSYVYGIEVRVIRCHPCQVSPSSKVYVYDGLYNVVSSSYGPGKSGPSVCTFKLMRIAGQDQLGSSTWCMAKDIKDKLASQVCPPGYISLDLSNGKEVLRVPVRNNVDNVSSPLHFEYITHPEFPLPLILGPVRRHKGCHCQGGTCGSKCSCARKNSGGPVYNEDGTLVRGRPVVYECGDFCDCTMSCLNRATQRGMKHQLELFRSRETGWGVRTLDLIQPGAFVCEFSGDVVAARDASMDQGSFIDPRRFPERWKEWGDASAVFPDQKKAPSHPFQGPDYVLDVSQRRNFASYIRHSSIPNVFVQLVIRGNENLSFPHLMVFAMDIIPPLRELSIDYGITQ